MGNQPSLNLFGSGCKCLHYVWSRTSTTFSLDKPIKTSLSTNNGHFMKMLAKLNEMRQSEILTDVEIRHGHTCFPCHSIVLFLRSSYFEKILSKIWDQGASDKNKTIQIEESDIEIDVIQNLLGFVYTGSIDIPKDQVVKYLEGAKKWDLLYIRISEKVNVSLYSQRESTNTVYSLTFTEEELDLPFIRVVEKEFEKSLKKKFSSYCPLPPSLNNDRRVFPPFNFVVNVSNEKSICCHRELLVTFSEYFYAMLSTSSFREHSQDNVTLQDVNETTLSSVITYMYASTTSKELNYSSAMDIASVTGWLCRESGLFQQAEEFLIESASWCKSIQLVQFAERHSLFKLHSVASYYAWSGLAWNVQFTHCKELKNLTPDIVCDYLSNDNLCVLNELDIISTVKRWAEEKKNAAHIYNVFKRTVRLHLLSLPVLERVIEEMKPYPQTKLHYKKETYDQIRNDIDAVCEIAKKMPLEMRILHYNQSFRRCCRKSVIMKVFSGGRTCFYIYSIQEVTGEEPTEIENPASKCLKLNMCCAFQYLEQNLLQFAVEVFNNLVYISGGKDECRVVLFHPLFHTWNVGPSLPEVRWGHRMVTVGDSLYVLGGYGKNGKFVKNVNKLKFRESKWTVETTVLFDAPNLVCVVWNETIYCFCIPSIGKSRGLLHCYSTKLQTWFQPFPLPFPDDSIPLYFTYAITFGDNIFVFGDILPLRQAVLVSIFDVKKEKWYPATYHLHTVGTPFVYNDKMYYLKSSDYRPKLLPFTKKLSFKISLLDMTSNGSDNFEAQDLLVNLPDEESLPDFVTDFSEPTNHPEFVNLYT
ncbi:kelch-like protein 25 [Clavelina lepadiformis]|uniref:kelch-like protein 25 n=1 Tax=Clavelina lepadiformis TaxID=159417 RepID=UPI004041BE77